MHLYTTLYAVMKPIRHKRGRGFTLIELMIVVAIIGVLSAIAYPSYVESVRKSKRADVRAQMVEVAQYMQKFYSQNDRYDKANNDLATPVAIPAGLTTVPRAGAGSTYYTISLVAGSLSARGYVLQAVPSGSMQGDKCGTFQLNQVGQRTVVGNSGGMTVATCWK